VVAALLAACATPADRFDRRANALGFSAIGLQGTGFRHVAYVVGALERSEPWGVWGGELFVQGVVVPRKRPRGRPRKSDTVTAA